MCAWSGCQHDLPLLEASEEPAELADSAEGVEGSDRCVPEEARASCDPGVLDVLGVPGDQDDLGVAACP